MTTTDIPDHLRQFIFEHVDSLAQLEVLFLMRTNAPQWFAAESLSRELRTSTSSVAQRLIVLTNVGLLEQNEHNKEEYRYAPKSPDLEALVTQLVDLYKIKPHKVLELIFSSVKRARQFADAFALTRNSKPDEDPNG